jgi:signal transduction histidine kinase
MSTIIWSMIAAACFTLAAIHGLVWWFYRSRLDRLAYVFLASATGTMALVEIAMMTAPTPGAFATALRWYHVPVWVDFLAIMAFVRLHLRAGRLWLGWVAVGARTVSLVLNFTVGLNLNYLSITGLREVRFLGGDVALPMGVPNPAMLVGQTGLLFLLLFVSDAALTVWRRGERRRSLLAGVNTAFFILLGSIQTVLSHWHVVNVPPVASLYFMGVILLMTFELSWDALRAGKLEEELRSMQEGKRREVAHLGRVATLGELSMTLAHEMNQPLAIILSNAQAAQRLLAKPQPDLPEVRDILGDIVSADLRAAEVIQRMRVLLKRGDTPRQLLDLNDVLAEVLQLMRGALRERQVTLTQEASPALPGVLGDRVQLQQVLLNMILNACEAMQDTPPVSRQLRVRAESAGQEVRVSVTDSGRGLPPDVEPLFEPFYTSKDQGLGMGLAICRSIVSAHQGRLRAFPNPDGGAIFEMTLPALESAL